MPSIYDTRYSSVFSLYGTEVELKKLKSNIISDGSHRVILVTDSPHYLSAIECLNNVNAIKTMRRLDKNLIIDYIKENNLIHSRRYVDYVRQAHPETDAIETFVGFIALMIDLYSYPVFERRSNISVLVQQRLDESGNRFWLLIDGLHRSAILLALSEVTVTARVKFP